MVELYACAAKELQTVVQPVCLGIYDAFDACLYDEFGAFDAGGGGDVERGAIAGVVGTCQLGDGIGFGMQDVGLGHVAVVFANVFEARGGAIVAIGDDGLVFHDKCTDLTALAVGVLCPNTCHAHVAAVEVVLFVVCFCHGME